MLVYQLSMETKHIVLDENKEMMMSERKYLPVIALRGMTVLPGMLMHFDISRSITIESVEQAMKSDQRAFLVMQKDDSVEIPEMDDLHAVGTIATIKQIIKLPGNVIRVMVSGEVRGILNQLTSVDPYLVGDITECETENENLMIAVEREAILRHLKGLLEVFAVEYPKVGKDIIKQLYKTNSIEELMDQIAANYPLSVTDRQKILEAVDLNERYEILSIILVNEIEIGRIRRDIQARVKEKVDKNQKEYVLREQLKVIREELGENNVVDDAANYLEQLKRLDADDSVKEAIEKEINRFRQLSNSSAESTVSRGYIETLLALPWNKSDEERIQLKEAEKILNRDHFGLTKVKERVLEYLAVRSYTGKDSSQVICLVGPPGTGKTSIARSIANCMGRKYTRVSLGGVRDEAEIRGHRRTYVGALPGRIVNAIKSAGVNNPVMLLDEIDKVGNDYKGDPASALLELLDTEQNKAFVDHYVEIPVDLSKVTFIATANTLDTIPRPLLDRMELIELSSYTENEKLHIAKDYLIKKQMEKHGLPAKELSISKKAISEIILSYTKEAGVRSLERKIGDLCRKAVKEKMDGENGTIKITEKNLEKYLGKKRYHYERRNDTDEIGIARGLAWTSVGGDTLSIEVNVMPGKGVLELTGKLGDVMKESAKAGISYIRSNSDKFQISDDYFEKHDIHIHIPQGAVPKDGPSAGITMATAMLSAITEKKVKKEVAMTGEITLRGRVLQIGGLKEKLLAAKLAGITIVLVPIDNKPDVLEIEKEIIDGLDIRYVSTMNEVIENAFVTL